jgi:hypothetical protein
MGDGMEKFEVGEWYRVRFLDHVMGMDKALPCTIFGYVVKVNENSIAFSWWECDDPDYKDDNKELITIVTKTIVCAKKVPKNLLKF